MISRDEWATRVEAEEKAMFLLFGTFTGSPTNKKARDLCFEVKDRFFDKIKDDHPDAVFALFDVSTNDAPVLKVKYDVPGVLYFPKGSNSRPAVFDKMTRIGLGGSGDPLEGGMHLTTFKNWASKAAGSDHNEL